MTRTADATGIVDVCKSLFRGPLDPKFVRLCNFATGNLPTTKSILQTSLSNSNCPLTAGVVSVEGAEAIALFLTFVKGSSTGVEIYPEFSDRLGGSWFQLSSQKIDHTTAGALIPRLNTPLVGSAADFTGYIVIPNPGAHTMRLQLKALTVATGAALIIDMLRASCPVTPASVTI